MTKYVLILCLLAIGIIQEVCSTENNINIPQAFANKAANYEEENEFFEPTIQTLRLDSDRFLNPIRSSSTTPPRVHVDNLGTAQGVVLKSALDRRDFYAFFGIPFAEKPELFQVRAYNYVYVLNSNNLYSISPLYNIIRFINK